MLKNLNAGLDSAQGTEKFKVRLLALFQRISPSYCFLSPQRLENRDHLSTEMTVLAGVIHSYGLVIHTSGLSQYTGGHRCADDAGLVTHLSRPNIGLGLQEVQIFFVLFANPAPNDEEIRRKNDFHPF